MDYLSIVYDRYSKPKTKYPALLAKEILKDLKLKKASHFEIGCGNGDLLNEFSQLGLNVTGTDLLSGGN